MRYRPYSDHNKGVAESPFSGDKRTLAAILGAINSSFERRTVSRGLTYSRTHKVLDFDFDPVALELVAHIKGSANTPYQTTVGLSADCAYVAHNECTCPVKFDCKHAAAALWSLYASLQKDGVNPLLIGSDPGLLPEAAPVNAKLRNSLEELAKLLNAAPADETEAEAPGDRPRRAVPEHSQIVYVLRSNMHGRLTVEALKVFIKSDGSFGRSRELDIYSPFDSRIRSLDPQDSVIVRLLADSYLAEESSTMGGLPADANLAATIVNLILATKRAHWREPSGPLLITGDKLPGALEWLETYDGLFKLSLCAAPRPPEKDGKNDDYEDDDVEVVVAEEVKEVQNSADAEKLENKKNSFGGSADNSSNDADGQEPPGIKTFIGSRFYVDENNGELGTLFFDPPLPEKVFQIIDNLAPISKREMQGVRTLLDSAGMPTMIPRPKGTKETELRLLKPVPCLWLETKKLPKGKLDFAVFTLEYPDGLSEKEPQRTFLDEKTDKLVVEKIDPNFEFRAKNELAALGFTVIQNPQSLGLVGRAVYLHALDEKAWTRFIYRDRKVLEKQGWDIRQDLSFKREVIFGAEDTSDWGMSVEQAGSHWFEIELGIMVNGKRVSLLPILEKIIRSFGPDPLADDLEKLCIDGKFLCPMEDGNILALPFERIRGMLNVLLELYGQMLLGKKDDLSLNVAQAARLIRHAPMIACSGTGAATLRAIDERLHSFEGVGTVETPKSFKAELRSYQKTGVAWLQFLREFQLGGILADDMGLGKTIQTLAHICIDKEAGRLKYPVLVICPVSVLPNWIDEAKRFAPTLKVLSHRGVDRTINFKKAPQYDLVVTTFSLLTRDLHLLTKQPWHGVFLDEAQAIKNGNTKNKEAALALDASHKVCLTGTPVENNLSELWSLLDFTMPDILGTAKQFNEDFRYPIEKRKDKRKREMLAKLISPFLVRRTKEAVAPELPAKTVIVQSMKLEGDQRDLYETVRLAMLEQVKTAIQLKGLAKSQIIILTAMLRLRQVCCDPRILGLDSALNVKRSVKLDALMELVLPLVEEGRKILLFSQFTSMLDIIGKELTEYQIPFVEIRGNTKDRRIPVEQFQAGLVPVFLISLKAGGTGLNLTAADTVIHYDPWWNPAVEDQATDRAHRIGQDKPVFVYKLIATETIEDRMRELQEKKRALYQAILDGDKNATVSFTQKDLDLLFSPLQAEE